MVWPLDIELYGEIYKSGIYVLVFLKDNFRFGHEAEGYNKNFILSLLYFISIDEQLDDNVRRSFLTLIFDGLDSYEKMRIILDRWYDNIKWMVDENGNVEWENIQNQYLFKFLNPIYLAQQRAKDKNIMGKIYSEEFVFKPIVDKLFPFGSSIDNKTDKLLDEYEFLLNKFREDKIKEKEILKKLEKKLESQPKY